MAETKRYEWRVNRTKVSAEVAGREFNRLEMENGELRENDIIAAAEPETSPIHGLFEWNDTVAARKYRLKQAQGHIQNLRVITVRASGDTENNPAYVCVQERDAPCTKGRYIQTERAREEGYGDIVLRKAVHDLKAWQRRYDSLQRYFGGVFDAIDELPEGTALMDRRGDI